VDGEVVEGVIWSLLRFIGRETEAMRSLVSWVEMRHSLERVQNRSRFPLEGASFEALFLRGTLE
jgi:hypothetical protein